MGELGGGEAVTGLAGNTWKGIHLCDHASPGLVTLTVRGPLLLLLQHPFPASAVLKCKLAQCVAKLHDAHLTGCLCRVAQVEQEGMEPGQVEVGWVVPPRAGGGGRGNPASP